MNSPLTRNQIIRLLSQHPLNPKILFKEKPSPMHPTLMFDLREKPDGGAEAIFYPTFFRMPPEDQHKFLNKALEHLDELYQLSCTNPSKAMMLMAQNLLQMENSMSDPKIDPSFFDDDHDDDSHPLGVESPAAPLPSLEDLLRENHQQLKEAVDSFKELQNEDPDKVLLARNFNIHKDMAMEILESFVGLSLSRLSPELVTQMTNRAVLCIREMAEFHHQLISLVQQDLIEQDQT